MASQVPPNQKPAKWADKPLPPSKELEQPEDYKNTFRGRAAISKFADPCQAAAQASYDCLERTHYNRQECMDFFQSYRECKKKWLDQRREDRRLGKDVA